MDFNPDLVRMLRDIGISDEEMESSYSNISNWANQVRHVESDNNPMASPGTTSAKGVYQFVDASVPVAKQRMKNMGYDKVYYFDETSKYPAEMCKHKIPYGNPTYVYPNEDTNKSYDNVYKFVKKNFGFYNSFFHSLHWLCQRMH